MKSFYCIHNENLDVPFTPQETYTAFAKKGNVWHVYDDKGQVKSLFEENGHSKFVVGHFKNKLGREVPLFAEFEVF